MTTQSATITAKEILATCLETKYQYFVAPDGINDIQTESKTEYTVKVYELPNGTILVPGTNTHESFIDWFFSSINDFEPNGTARLENWRYTGNTLGFEPKELIKSAYGTRSKYGFGYCLAIYKVLELVPQIQMVQVLLERLELDADTDPSKGIKVYDDHASGVYEPSKLVAILESLSEDEVTLENVWQLIAPAAI